jgi:hypothetical protein
LSASSLWVPVGQADAIGTAQAALQPVPLPHTNTPRGDFSYRMTPGQEISDEFELSNYTAQPQSYFLYGADGYDNQSGGFVLRQRGYHNVEVGKWISILTSSYTVAPHTAVIIPFAVQVPLDASPGDHVGGVVALNAATAPAINGKVSVQIRQGLAVAVYVRVVGPVHPAVAITKVGALSSEPTLAFVNGDSKAHVFFTVDNVGNEDLHATAKANVEDVFGRTVKTFPSVKMPLIIPGAIFTVIEPPWKPLPIAGPEHIVVHLSTDKAGTISATDILWILPWLLVLALVVVILAIVGLLLWRRRRRRRPQPAQEPEPVPQPETEEVGAAP